MKCHKLGAGPSAQKCLDCHQEIAVRMGQEKGYHHVAVNVDNKGCFACHSDHAGRDFRLIDWPGGRDAFDHKATGWTLEGVHAKTECRRCHKPDLIRDDLRQFQERIDLSTTFLGLHETCVSCHMDEHREQFAADCTTCHGNDAWKPVVTFDHARTTFPLTGKHSSVDCAKCHKREKDSKPWDTDNLFSRFKPVAYENCTNCHKDPHKGRLGDDCASCHATSGWQDVVAKNFDHSRTKYPLLGKHATLSCEKCHKSGKQFSGMRFASCTDCHRDEHHGEFAHRKDKGRCESCHTVKGFRPSLYSVAEHARSDFALKGAHLAQPCVACHTKVRTSKGVEFTRFQFRKHNCEACHQDVHKAQLKPKNCETCHKVDSWYELAFDHDHNSSYRLEGEHRYVKCSGCHMKITKGGATFRRYKPIDPSCKTCHTREGLELKVNG